MIGPSLSRHDREIGEVGAVTSIKVVVEIHEDLTSPIHSYPGGQSTIAQIGAYLVFPIGAGESVVGVIIGAYQHEGYEPDPRSGMTLQLSKPRRTLHANLLGTLSTAGGFRHGVAVYPTLGSPALVPSVQELKTVLDASKRISTDQTIPLELGSSPMYETVVVSMSLDDLFSRPLALVGNTGSGKSWSVAKAIQACRESLASRGEYSPKFIILDINGEYGNAFGLAPVNGEPNRVRVNGQPYTLPLWSFNLHELVSYFDASIATQVPVLDRAVTFAREDAHDQARDRGDESSPRIVRRQLRRLAQTQGLLQVLHRYSQTDDGVYVGRDARGVLIDLDGLLSEESTVGSLCTATDAACMRTVRRDLAELGELRATDDRNAFYHRLSIDLRDSAQLLNDHLEPLLQSIQTQLLMDSPLPILTSDTPSPFDPARLDQSDLFDLAASGVRSEERIREYVATLRLRIRRKLQDRRWSVFQTGGAESMRAVLEPLLGSPHIVGGEIQPGREDISIAANGAGADVVVVDCSMLAYDVLPFFCAVVGRLLLDVREHANPAHRIDGPWVLVLEEAHNYLRPRREGEDPGLTLSREAFERIAKEGRKFGLSLVIASQRPSDVSETVLSQCANFIVHRIQNPDDIDYFKRILPGSSREMLDQVSILTPGEALLLGSAVNVPCRVKVWEPQPNPHSETPRPSHHWKKEIAERFRLADALQNWMQEDSTDSPPPGGAPASSSDAEDQADPWDFKTTL